MFSRLFLIAAAASGVTMCASPRPDEEPSAQTGPDGLVLRPAPSTGVDAGALPPPRTSEDEETDEESA